MSKLKALFPILVIAVLVCIAWLVSPAEAARVGPCLGVVALVELKRKRKDVVAKMEALVAKDTLTAEEETQFAALQTEEADLGRQIARIEATAAARAAVGQVDQVPRPPVVGDLAAAPQVRIPNPGFQSISEMLFFARTQPRDSRVVALMEMNTGSSGGIAVPDEFLAPLLQVPASEAIVRPRATLLPQGASPDAAVTMPALEQGAAGNMYGGVTVDWTSEGVASAEASGKLKEITLQPKEVAAHVVVTNTLLRNWQGCGATIEMLLRNALIAAEDVAFLSANGVARPMGVLSAPCLKAVNREEASKVSYLDLVNMEAEFLDSPAAVWVVSKRAVRQLRIMEDNAGQLIWSDPKGSTPGMLMGRPVVTSFRSPALGVKGDVLLADFTYYLIRDGASVVVAASEHVYFKERKTVIQIAKSVDGAPWLNEAISQEDAQTYSPFVALDVPA